MLKAMCYPLKEALKAICGDNQWSYAVFWKFGCQNPKLLIWEDCYYNVMPCSIFPSNSKSRNESLLEQLKSCWLSHEAYAQPLLHVGEGVHFLVNKMTNQVHMVGEGLVGRTAFTGNHEWIVSGSFSEMVHPPEVLSEVHLQFSAGMQTIAVIPVIPHGVLQLGSSWAMMENVGLIEDVKKLILQVVSLPSALFSGNKMRDGPVEEFRPPFNHTNSVSLDPYGNMKSFSSNVAFDGGSRVDIFQDSVLVDQTSRSTSRKNQDNPKPTSGELSDCLFPNGFPDKHKERDLYEGLNIAVSKQTDQMPSANLIPCCNKTCYGSDVPSCTTSLSYIQPSVGEDLFDVLGANFKNKILNGYICESSKYGPVMVDEIKGKSIELTSSPHPDCDVMSESGMLSKFGSDHLLDAVVVSGVQPAATQSTSENLSCRTTLTKGSISSGLCSISHPMDELLGHSRPSMSSIGIGVAFTRSTIGKNDAANCAQTMSYSGSHVSSWVDQWPTAKNENIVATANLKKFDVVGKKMRKRLKPGENPRPRPKDRQLIQDRLKELREMIPNGAKCSIDALLEQTIKHMLFLQNVSKHADKLKQTVESKIIDKDGELLLQDNFEGGATWAFEVDSQARMCPIIVEDLHSPHHFLVEMLCEERGFFLEIADVIRGMGLSILKGVIQKRDDKIWAHFAVEANREITRMEIFLSLVHLLKHTMKSSYSPTKEGLKVYNTLTHPTFDPVTSVLGN